VGLLPRTITVNVREANGMPLEGHAFVKLSSQTQHYGETAAVQDNSAATFENVTTGDYEIEVNCAGYKTAVEHVSFRDSAGIALFVYLHSETEAASVAARPPGPKLTPKLQQNLDKAFEKMRKRQYDAAREHFEKAAKLAPANPDIPYMLGMIEYNQQHFDLARAQFEKALTLDPAHERSLTRLGELQLRAGDAAGAIQTLEKAYLANGADWRMHYLLAQAYNEQKDYPKAALHATRAAELGGDQAAQPLLLLAQIYSSKKDRDRAKQVLDMLTAQFPGDPAAKQAKAQIAALDANPSGAEPAASSSATGNARSSNAAVASVMGAPESLPLSREAMMPPWAPPDVDSKEYALAPNVACSQSQVLVHAQGRMRHQLQNFERFMATEHIEHREVDRNGNEGDVRAKDFSYLVFVHPFKNDSFFLEESRDGGMGVDSFPTSLATTGLVGLGVAVLEREYQDDFDFKCEGLSSWRGQAAWQLRFEQKRGVPSRVRVWRRGGALFPVSLKGRVWVAANSFDLLHLETDLRDPIEKLFLTRDHLAVDYGPVTFQSGNEKLWLPWKAEMFMEIHGKRYHHQHTLTDYMLFSVDTANQIGKPKLPSSDEDAQPKN
jgi:tetratricopeptide (TPR) repeat protein